MRTTSRCHVVLWGARKSDRQFGDALDRRLKALASGPALTLHTATSEVGEATRQYQAILEELRSAPDDEHLIEQMKRAWSGLQAEWLEQALRAA